MKDKVITVDNGKQFYIIDEQVLNDRRFAFAVEVDSHNELIKDNYLFLELINDGDGYSLISVKDSLLRSDLSKIFIDDMNNI